MSRPVVTQDHRLVVTECVGEALALLEVEDDSGVVVEDAVVLVEGAHVLGDGIERSPERRPRLPVDGMGVGCRNDVGPRLVDLRVDDECGLIDHGVALNDLADPVDENQIGNPDVSEMHPERVDPEVVELLGITGRDVASHTLVEPEL